MQAQTSNEIRIWICRRDKISSPKELSHCRDLLSDAERRREEEFRLPCDRHAYLVTRAMQRLLLSRSTTIDPHALEFDRGFFGRPSLRQASTNSADLDFNLSHDGDIIVLGIAHGAKIGIDVIASACRPSFETVARRFFQHSEIAALEALPVDVRADAFLQLWALKEAYVKMLGDGLSIPFNTFGFCLKDPSFIEFRAHKEDKRSPAPSFLLLRPVDGVVLALCTKMAGRTAPALSLYEFSPFAEDKPIKCQPTRTSSVQAR